MGRLIEEDITGKVKSNVFYDTFKETVEFYKNTQMEVWKESYTITLINTGAEVGLFNKSDIIIVYDAETFLPSIVTERIFKKNYSKRDWYKIRKYLKYKTSIIKQELGYNVRISFASDYIDYVHYKEEWWQWALKRQQHL